ncbi:hypothetical protein ACHAO8_010178 [Botrytis cinerea]
MAAQAPPTPSTFQQDRTSYVYFMGRNVERTKIYAYRLLSHPIGGEFHKFTPQDIAGSEILQRRVRDFTLREFQKAFLPFPLRNITRLEEVCNEIPNYIVDILKIYHLRENVNELKREMACIFRRRNHAEIFLHELRSWMESGYDTLDLWDQKTGYTAPPLRLRPAMPRRGVPYIAPPLRLRPAMPQRGVPYIAPPLRLRPAMPQRGVPYIAPPFRLRPVMRRSVPFTPVNMSLFPSNI